MVITDRSDAVLRDPERAVRHWDRAARGGAAGGPALRPLPRRRRRPADRRAAPRWRWRWSAIGYPVQRDYLRDRFHDFDPSMNLDTAYRWANRDSDARIGLAGTTAGFLGYGFYGPDLSNRVIYLGREGPHGAFNAIPTCEAFRAAVNGADLDYLVTAPFLNFIHPERPLRSPEAAWLRGEPAVTPVNRDGPVTVWRVRRPARPGRLRARRPQRAAALRPRPAGRLSRRLSAYACAGERGRLQGRRPDLGDAGRRLGPSRGLRRRGRGRLPSSAARPASTSPTRRASPGRRSSSTGSPAARRTDRLPGRERPLPMGGGLAQRSRSCAVTRRPSAGPTGCSTRSATSCVAGSARPSAPASWPSSTPRAPTGAWRWRSRPIPSPPLDPQTLADAAFWLYLRGASDFAGGRQLALD